jgi:hypothetical protein
LSNSLRWGFTAACTLYLLRVLALEAMPDHGEANLGAT